MTQALLYHPPGPRAVAVDATARGRTTLDESKSRRGQS